MVMTKAVSGANTVLAKSTALWSLAERSGSFGSCVTVRHFQIIRATALLSAGVAALSLAACNKTGASQNGAYISGSTNTTLPVGAQSMPPSNTYQAVADTPPPPLPVYDQPPIPEPGYIWTPGYWDWTDADADYYWVPGTWIEPPGPDLLWTPGYWRFYDGRYLFSDGYWGPQVGFYGGVDYGYGYGGDGYAGGRWQGNQFYYNSQVNNLGGRRINTVYNQGVPASVNRVSYNGGAGGLRVAPAPAEVAAAQARHAPPTRAQFEQTKIARSEPQLRASANRGSPPIAATSRPTAFHGAAGVTAARSAATYAPPARHALTGEATPHGIAGPASGRVNETPGRASATVEARPTDLAGRAAPAERPAANRAQSAPMQAPQMRPSAPMRAAPRMDAPQTRAPQMSAPAPIRAAPQTRGPQMSASTPIRAAPQARAAAPRAAAQPAPQQTHGEADRPR